MKRSCLKKIAELVLLTGDLGSKIRRLPDDTDTPALAQVELTLRDALAALRAARNAIAMPETVSDTSDTDGIFAPYAGPVDDGA